MKRRPCLFERKSIRELLYPERKTQPSYRHPGLLIPFTLVLFASFIPVREALVSSSRSYGIRNLHSRMLDREEATLFMDLKVSGEKSQVLDTIFSFRDILTVTFSLTSVLGEFVTYAGDIAFEAVLVNVSSSEGNVQKAFTISFDDASEASVSFVIDSADYPYALDFDYSKTTSSFMESTASVFWLDSGLSADPNATYARAPITLDNFNAFFVFETKTSGSGSTILIRPREVSSLADYAVTITFENGEEAKLRRNGTYERFTSEIGGAAILEVEGYRDAYPGKTAL